LVSRFNFNTIPIKVPVSYFVNIDKFVWKNNKPRKVDTILRKQKKKPNLTDSHHTHCLIARLVIQQQQ
jgi:hypothetical protein